MLGPSKRSSLKLRGCPKKLFYKELTCKPAVVAWACLCFISCAYKNGKKYKMKHFCLLFQGYKH